MPFEDLGAIESWAVSSGYEISCTRLFAGDDFPEAQKVDLLVIMGGPMGIYDEKEYNWLVKEKEFINSYIKTGKPVVGICLGAQLLADALGAKVYKNSQKEIGWLNVKKEVNQYGYSRFSG